ncbi:hypothetical protein [Saccharothrix hoggarensis]|uniref:Uncharacterized protein n=1 Tax=Saccharothrix hoggarensis TaxID=913853 RepID=A0ABW3QWU3_9PSEU
MHPRDRNQPGGRFAWADVPVLGLAFAAAWYLTRYEHYSVPAAVATSAAALGLFTVALSAPRCARRVAALLVALGGAPASAPLDPTSAVSVSEPVGRR